MLLKWLKYLFKDFYIFTAAYSNNMFPDPLEKEEETFLLEKMLSGDIEDRKSVV